MAARPHSARPRPGLTMAAPLPAAAPRLPAALPAPSSSRSPAPPPRIAPGPAACGQREEPGGGGGTAAGTEAFWGSFGRNLSPRRPQGGLGLWGGRGLLEAGGLQLPHRSKASGFGLLMKYFPSLSAQYYLSCIGAFTCRNTGPGLSQAERFRQQKSSQSIPTWGEELFVNKSCE